MKTKSLISSAIFGIFIVFCEHGVAFAQSQHSSKPAELKEAEDYFNSFLNAWLIDQDMELAKNYIDTDDNFFKDGLKHDFKISDPAFNYQIWLTKTLLMWLEEDHGDLDALGHGDPSYSGYANMPVKLEDLKHRLRWRNSGEALKGKEIGEHKDGKYFGFIIFKHAPRDGIIFLFKKVGTEWSIFYYIWMVA